MHYQISGGRSTSSPRMVAACTAQVCQGTRHIHCHVMDRDVMRHALHRMCPHPDRTRRLHPTILRVQKHLGHANTWSSEDSCKGRILGTLLLISCCSVEVGPSEVDALQLGTPFMGMLDHGNSNVPSACDLIAAFVIRPFCLRTACVMTYAVSLLHTGMKLRLGMAWWIASARRRVPFECDERKKTVSSSLPHVSTTKLTSCLK